MSLYQTTNTLISTNYLDHTCGHKIYYEQYGNASGIPVLIIHGGPGAGMSLRPVNFFNPEKYWIIIFDQRGVGKSMPNGKLEHNTTQDLINDMELLRKKLDIDNWVVCGGSWGASLALLYSEQYPDKVKTIILRGTFLCRQQDTDDFIAAHGKAAKMHPEAWRQFISELAPDKQHDVLNGYAELIYNPDPAIHLPACYAWNRWEIICSTPKAYSKEELNKKEKEVSIWVSRVMLHYILNHFFLKNLNEILDNIATIKNIPLYIVHGQMDYVAPINQSHELKKALNQVKLYEVKAGHSDDHPAIQEQFMKITDEVANNDIK